MLTLLVYRINSTREVNEYVLAMGITFPSCFWFSVEDYQPSTDKKILLKKAFNYLWDVNLIDIPIESELPSFRKPIHFLFIVFAETCGKEDIKKKVGEAFECRDPQIPQTCSRSLTYFNTSVKKFKSQYLFPLVQSRAIANDKDVLAKKDAFVGAMKTLGHKFT